MSESKELNPNPGENRFPLKEYLEGQVEEDLDYIKFTGKENKLFQGLREKHFDDWEIVEGCREILFENAKLIKFLKERIDDTKTRIKELGGKL